MQRTRHGVRHGAGMWLIMRQHLVAHGFAHGTVDKVDNVALNWTGHGATNGAEDEN